MKHLEISLSIVVYDNFRKNILIKIVPCNLNLSERIEIEFH